MADQAEKTYLREITGGPIIMFEVALAGFSGEHELVVSGLWG